MNLSEKYRPRTLCEVVGQVPPRMLAAFVRRPFRSCWLLEGPGGTGKSATAFALAHDLGQSEWSLHVVQGAKLNKDRAEELFEHTLRLRPFDGSPWHLVIVEEFERIVSPEVKAYLKTALDQSLDPEVGLSARAIIVATSNDASRIDDYLLERFRIKQYSSGPTFAEAAQERLAWIWDREVGGDMPFTWRQWGWIGERFSMRRALREMDDWIALSECVAANQGESV